MHNLSGVVGGELCALSEWGELGGKAFEVAQGIMGVGELLQGAGAGEGIAGRGGGAPVRRGLVDPSAEGGDLGLVRPPACLE